LPLCLAITVSSGIVLLVFLKLVEKCIGKIVSYLNKRSVKSKDEFYESQLEKKRIRRIEKQKLRALQRE
jgi:hypothetical protein